MAYQKKKKTTFQKITLVVAVIMILLTLFAAFGALFSIL
ncbi:DUF4044 domain-containing protein [Lactococcus termiticola]|uniref:DUF4044 domain-containing protein n=1 Tax=Lactococcus termiticola TaxID=2169526 RepID=A0A2R5HG87_9LACT|nr:DUF4044 domain-containing protein [Lactococcus termiticola]GBG97002.1 hypothetical protein NtB2_01139 [Lactococcus termiticola]